jgi:hypothetical protein
MSASDTRAGSTGEPEVPKSNHASVKKGGHSLIRG